MRSRRAGLTAHKWTAVAFWARLCLGPLALAASGCTSGRPWAMRLERGPSVVASFPVHSASAELRVVTFNVWGLPAWVNGVSCSRHAHIRSALGALDADVVLLQEVWTRQCYETLSGPIRGESRAWWTAAARREGGFLGQNGLLTLSRYPIERAEFHAFDSARFPDSLMNKGALKVTLLMHSGQRFNVWNVHLQDGASARVRTRQVGQLMGWIRSAQDGQVADVVGGDFNFAPSSAEFREFVTAIGPSVHQLAGSAPLPTWDGRQNTPEAGEALDHIFLMVRHGGERLEARARRVFGAATQAARLSDHLGVEALITLRDAEAAHSAALALSQPSPTRPKDVAMVDP